ncbi:MAG: o-succinylbenzoate synthase [Bacteroidales bacterium]|nr:o-succinylbenzoate synthase [Bacteroidales bacterium]
MLKTQFTPYNLIFKRPSGTSRGVLTTKETRFVKVWHDHSPEIFGLGECAIFRGLGCDDRPDYEEMLQSLTHHLPSIDELRVRLRDFPSILFGLETALADLENGGKRIIFPSSFSEGKQSIRINGLIWMGTKAEMRVQIIEKIEKGFSCIKLKIGAIDFEAEMDLLQAIRNEFDAKTIELRVDANGAFSTNDAMAKLERLAKLDIHSIEQPIKAGQWHEMARLCAETPIPITLDEELIGVNISSIKKELLETIKPQYIILKPSLHGGFAGSEEWISLANQIKIGWWATSALESNIGLNAIAQWCSIQQNNMPQGLGTGQLYTNNIDSPLTLEGENLFYMTEKRWDIDLLEHRLH